MIYSLQSPCSKYFEEALIRDVGISHDSIVKIPDPSYIDRIAKGVLISPGGNTFDIICQYSPSQGLERLRACVIKGTHYWGICAGGNLGAMQYFYKEDPRLLHVTESKLELSDASFKISNKDMHTLNLLPVFADGPNFLIDHKPYSGKAVKILTKNQESFYVYWNKGSAFIRNNSLEECVASYEENKIAAVFGHQGLGSVLLMGCHPEITFYNVQKDFPLTWTEENQNYQLLKKDDEKRAAWMRELAKSVDIPPKN